MLTPNLTGVETVADHPVQGKQADGTKGILIDMQSINLLITIYDNLKSKNQAKFNSVLQDEYKFANLLDKMWGWVK